MTKKSVERPIFPFTGIVGQEEIYDLEYLYYMIKISFNFKSNMSYSLQFNGYYLLTNRSYH